MAMGDALAVALLEERGLGAEDFARLHPGGALGRRLLLRVADVMVTGPAAGSLPGVSGLSRSQRSFPPSSPTSVAGL